VPARGKLSPIGAIQKRLDSSSPEERRSSAAVQGGIVRNLIADDKEHDDKESSAYEIRWTVLSKALFHRARSTPILLLAAL